MLDVREALKELTRVEKDSEQERTAALLSLQVAVSAIVSMTSDWDLRPAWQLSSALELLLKRVAEKPRNFTSSSLRTICNAIDTLHQVCVSGVRPNLIIEPPLKILAVDDDPLCLRALLFAMQKAHLHSDTAANGVQAVELAQKTPYDIVFMDIQMPEMDGIEACARIREGGLNATTPIVFVTIASDFATRARTTASGGNDFMAKPFLVFELSLKAMTVVMRSRLEKSKPNRIYANSSPMTATAAMAGRVARDIMAAPPKPEAPIEA